jgi:hypothetical protein
MTNGSRAIKALIIAAAVLAPAHAGHSASSPSRSMITGQITSQHRPDHLATDRSLRILQVPAAGMRHAHPSFDAAEDHRSRLEPDPRR